MAIVTIASSSVHALLIADTHLGEGQAEQLVDKIGAQLALADVVFHAGDITDPSLLTEIERYAPVHAVLGNNDRGMLLPQRLQVDIGGCRVAMVHDSGDAAGRTQRLRRWFPSADVVVFGHSHTPWNVADVDPAGVSVQHHVNPGSAMQRRRQPRCTIGWLQIENGSVRSITIDPV